MNLFRNFVYYPKIFGVIFFLAKFIKIAENLKPLITNLALLGMFITAISGIIFAYVIPSPVAHSFWILGLALMFITGIIYIYAISPLKVSYKVQSKEYASVFSYDVTQLAFFITIILFLLSAMLGGYYASHFGFNEDVKVFLLEEHSTKEYRELGAPSTPLELSVA